MERLPNYGNFQQLWDFYTGTGGLNPTQAAGMLGNIYAESRGNPGAVNPGDGSMGGDSRGIIQWNEGRESALRNFAAERGTVANDLLTQARFSLMEGRVGSERAGFAQGMAGQTPEEAALGFASGYIRPAAEHIPQRAEYGRMMYDIFAGGNPNGVQPGLAFNPEQAERQARVQEEQAANGGPMLSYGDLRRTQATQDIVKQLMEAAQLPELPEPPMPGPRSGFAQDAPPQIATNEGPEPLRTSPQLGEIATAENIDKMFPAQDGAPKTSELLEQTIAPIADYSAYRLGVPVEDAPKTIEEVARAASEPVPAAEDTSDEAEKKRNRRLLAADMLSVLSVGLGQLGSGQAVNVGPQLQAQQERRMLEDQQRTEAAQQQQQAQVLSQELMSMNMPGMAKIAMSGPEGYAQALSTLGTVKGRAPATTTGFASLPQPARAELLRAAGFSNQDVEMLSAPGMEAIAADAIAEQVKPDAEAEGLKAEGSALLGAAAPYMSAPAVNAAARRLAANPGSADAISDMQAAITEAGGDLPAQPMPAPLVEALAGAAGRAMDDPLVQQALAGDPNAQQILQDAAAKGAEKGAEVTAETGIKATAEAQEATQVNTLARAIGNELAITTGNPALRGIFANVRSEQQLGQALSAVDLPSEVKTALAANGNPMIRDALMELRLAEAGTDNPQNEVYKGRLEREETITSTLRTNLATRQPMVSAMEAVVEMVTAPGYDPNAGGPLAAVRTFAQNLGEDVLGPGFKNAIQSEDENIAYRVLESTIGENFGNFRTEGSGSTSDIESQLFISAMPTLTSSAVKQAAIAQRLINAQQQLEIMADARDVFLYENANNPDMIGDPTKMKEYVAKQVDEAGLVLFPTIDQSDPETFTKQLTSGAISPKTVVRVVSGGKATYMFFKDLRAQALGGQE